jgi:hypothetical protein
MRVSLYESAIAFCFGFSRKIRRPATCDFCNTIGTLLPRANAAACPQLAKADFASSSQHVREGQHIAELEAEIDAPAAAGPCAGRGATADVQSWFANWLVGRSRGTRPVGRCPVSSHPRGRL